MSDKQPEPQAQLWHRPDGQPSPHPTPAPLPVAPKLTPAGPLHGTDTIMVSRDGAVPVAVPMSVVAAYVVSTMPAKGAAS